MVTALLTNLQRGFHPKIILWWYTLAQHQEFRFVVLILGGTRTLTCLRPRKPLIRLWLCCIP